MNFKTMYLISREKYNALNRRLIGDDSENKRVAPLVEKGGMSGSVPNYEIDDNSIQDKRSVTSEKTLVQKKDQGLDIEGGEKFSFEKHVKLYDCPNLKERDREDRNGVTQNQDVFENQTLKNEIGVDKRVEGEETSKQKINTNQEENNSIKKREYTRKRNRPTDGDNTPVFVKRRKKVKSLAESCSSSKKGSRYPTHPTTL